MNKAIYGKTVENLRNRIDVLLQKQQKRTKPQPKPSKLSYMAEKIFDNNFFAIRKSKVALKFKKPTYTGMCILK